MDGAIVLGANSRPYIGSRNAISASTVNHIEADTCPRIDGEDGRVSCRLQIRSLCKVEVNLVLAGFDWEDAVGDSTNSTLVEVRVFRPHDVLGGHCDVIASRAVIARCPCISGVIDIRLAAGSHQSPDCVFGLRQSLQVRRRGHCRLRCVSVREKVIAAQKENRRKDSSGHKQS